jgi:hypothetical protein
MRSHITPHQQKEATAQLVVARAARSSKETKK